MKKESHFRGALAGEIHRRLMTYINQPTLIHLNQFNDILLKADEADLLELSIHGDSILIDILHLPIERKMKNPESYEIVSALFDKLMQRLSNFPAAKKALLIQKNSAGFTPLHDVLILGNPENVKVYFDEVRLVVKHKTISSDEYKKLLILPNQAGFTPLHHALKSGNS